MKYKIGIYGSAVEGKEKLTKKALELGTELGKQKNILLITGAGHGIPYLVASTAARLGIEIWGFPPSTTLEEFKEYMPQADISIYSKLFYVPSNFAFIDNIGACRQYRNLISTANADAGIIISGRWGSMSEFTALREMGKTIGVLTDTGGLAEELESLTQKFNKESKGKVIFNSSPKELVEKLIGELDKIKLS